MSYVEDWTTWAGDNPVEAEKELREQAEASFARVIRAGLLHPSYLEATTCEEAKEPRHRADPDGAPQGAEMVTDPIDSPSYKGLAA